MRSQIITSPSNFNQRLNACLNVNLKNGTISKNRMRYVNPLRFIYKFYY